MSNYNMNDNWKVFYDTNNIHKTYNDSPKKKFFGQKAKSTTIEKRKQIAKYESKTNQCSICHLARPIAAICCE